MRARLAALTAALVVVLSACTDDPGSGPDPSPDESSQTAPSDPPLTEITVPCPEFADVAKRITDAQAALYGGTDGDAAIDDLVAEIESLKEGVPPKIEAALDDMAAAFRDAAELLANPTPANKARLAELSPRLAAAGQKITAYFTSQCE